MSCDYLAVKKTSIGKALFTTRALYEEEEVSRIDGKIIEDAEYGSCYCVEIEEGKSLEPGPPFRFLNHSCEPNCQLVVWTDGEVKGELWLVTLRDIEAGEELTIDYAWPADAAIPCLCGAATCRGWIVDPDELHLVESEDRLDGVPTVA